MSAEQPRDHLGHFVPRATVPRTDPDTWDDTCTHTTKGPDMTTDPFVPPAAEGLPLAALDSATEGADRLDAMARTRYGRNLLAHALTQLARDGWLRTEPAAPAVSPPVSRAAVLREAADLLVGLHDSLITAPETTGQYLAGLERAARELRRLADEERDEQEAQANLDQLADLLPRMADEVQPCDGCGHPEHSARECPVTLYGERCACDEPLAAEAPPAATHSCGNCEGIDPDTCLMNPNRPPEQCPNSEFDGYGLQCQKPAGHNLCTFEEEETIDREMNGEEGQ